MNATEMILEINISLQQNAKKRTIHIMLLYINKWPSYVSIFCVKKQSYSFKNNAW